MDKETKELLLALIDGLTETINVTQYYKGDKVIRGHGIKILKDTIKGCEKSNASDMPWMAYFDKKTKRFLRRSRSNVVVYY